MNGLIIPAYLLATLVGVVFLPSGWSNAVLALYMIVLVVRANSRAARAEAALTRIEAVISAATPPEATR